MTPYQFRKLYIGEFQPDPFEKLTNEQLRQIETNRFADRDDRKRARRLRIEREERQDIIVGERR